MLCRASADADQVNGTSCKFYIEMIQSHNQHPNAALENLAVCVTKTDEEVYRWEIRQL